MKYKLTSGIVLACCIALSGCKPKPVPTNSGAEPSIVSAEPGATNSAASAGRPFEQADPFAPCLEAAAKSKTVSDTVEGLQAVQYLMTCSENYLGSNPNGESRDDALRLWYKGIAASNEILRGIEKRGSADTQNPAEAQQQLVERETLQRLVRENGYIINRAFQYRTVQVARALYERMRDAGIKMNSAVPWLNQTNLSRRTTGVWEVSVDSSYDDGNFLVVREMGHKDPFFNIAGYGVYGPNVAITDSDQVDTKGWYGPTCSVKVSVEEKSFKYGCDAYLSGQVSDQVGKDLRKALEDAMVRKAKEPAGSPSV